MQRPPQFPGLLASRSSYQWINRIHRKFTEFTALELSAAERERLKAWLETEFVVASLRLEGVNVSRAQTVEAIETRRLNRPAVATARNESPETQAILNLLNALRVVEERVTNEGNKATLSVELLLQLPDGVTALRRHNETDDKAGDEAGGLSVRAEHLTLVIEQACRWFSMPSIAELNPVEQAALALLRLVEIAPFEAANERLAIVAASLFTLRSGLPPLIIAPANARQFHQAVREGRRMNTQPMVELVAVAVEQALAAMAELVLQLRNSTSSINRDRE